MITDTNSFVFFGTPDFATLVLDELEKGGFLPSLIVTVPDKPQGRKMTIIAPPTKIWAEKRRIPVLQPEKLDEDSFLKLKEAGSGLFIVAAYGKMIPKNILQLPKFGALNWHPSLLPKLRGSSPIVTSILSENKTGVSILIVDEEMDHGPIVAQKEILSWETEINDLPKASELQNILATEGGRMLVEIIPQYIRGEITPKPQNHENATYTKKIKKEDGLLSMEEDAEKNFRKIQAFDVWPRAHFFFESLGKKIRVIVTEAEIKNQKLLIKKVIPEGGKEISYEELLRQHTVFIGNGVSFF